MKEKYMKKTVLAYSGGLDTSAIIPWLKNQYGGGDVVAFVADIGQKRTEIKKIEKKAFQSGASECYVVDLRELFVSDYIYPVLKTGALYEGTYLLGTSMARPIIAKAQVELAIKIGADSLCHGATGKGNDQVRFETVYSALAPHLKIIAPWREWDFSSRKSLLYFLKEKNIATTASKKKIYSRDENIWHISTEGGVLENPWNRTNKDCWIWTIDPIESKENPEIISIFIEKGNVVAVNGEYFSPYNCLEQLNILGSKHGIGRIDIIENRLVGMKSRGCYETPGGTIMIYALRNIEQLVLDRDSFKWREHLGLEMSYVVYDGRWFSPLRCAIQASAESLAEKINGEIFLQLYKGKVTAMRKKSTNNMYSKNFVTFEEDKVYDHTHAEGFIRIFSLSSRIRTLKKKKNKLNNILYKIQ